MKEGKNKGGQVTVFIIIAIIIVLLGGIIYMFWDGDFVGGIPSDFEPVEKEFLDCVDEKTLRGVKILSTKGGYMEMPTYVKGSDYMPFSSELDFFGVDVPYWYFVSGNNIQMERVPETSDLEEGLEKYLDVEIQNCDFSDGAYGAFRINKGTPSTEVSIEEGKIIISVDMDLTISNDEETIVVRNHDLEVDSNLGALFLDAKEFYELEFEKNFLENYTVDFLRLYAPVDGFKIQCSSLTWNANDIFNDLSFAIESNFMAMKNKGAEDDYFALNLPIDSEIKIINSINFPSTYEVDPANSVNLVAKPIGKGQGLGALGFCFVPYHFVYNLRFPVLVQIIRGDEIFQFPLAVIIEANKPRKALPGQSFMKEDMDICEDKLSKITVEVYDRNSVPIDGAKISYKCFISECDIGETVKGLTTQMFPQCYNGNLVIEKEGYATYEGIFSTVKGGSVSVVLDKKYTKPVKLLIGGKLTRERAIINFIGDGISETILYPESKEVSLSEGTYDVEVYVYSGSSIKFPETKREQCYEVPTSGIGILFGMTDKECIEIVVPAQEISSVLIGGGKNVVDFSEFDLRRDNNLILDVSRIGIPKSLSDLEVTYALFEVQEIDVRFG